METLSVTQRLLDEAVDLKRRNDQLMAENTRLRLELRKAQQQIVRLKYLLRRSI